MNAKKEVFIRRQRLDELLKNSLTLDLCSSDKDCELADIKHRYFQLKSNYQNELDSYNFSEIFTTVTPISVQDSFIVIPNQCNIRLPK